MKYTNYLVNGKVLDVTQMISKNKYVKPVSILAALPIVSIGVIVITGILPSAVIADSVRNVKYRIYTFKRRHSTFVPKTYKQQEIEEQWFDKMLQKQKVYIKEKYNLN